MTFFIYFLLFDYSLQKVETKIKYCIYEPRAYIQDVIYLLWKRNDDGKSQQWYRDFNEEWMDLFWTVAFLCLHRDMSHHCILLWQSSNRPLQWPNISTASAPWCTRWNIIIVHFICFIKVRSSPVINIQHQSTQHCNNTINKISVIEKIRGRVKWQIKWQVHTDRHEHMYARINMFI